MKCVRAPRGGFRRTTVILLGIGIAGVSGCQRGDRSSTELPPPPIHDDVEPPSPEQLLTSMADFFSSHGDFEFEAFVTYEAEQETGQKLQFDLIHSVAVRQPDRLYWVTLRDDATTNTAWYADGVFTMLKQPEGIYGQIEVPGTISEMIEFVVNDYGIVVPFGDLLGTPEESVFLRDMEASLYAGLAWVEGAWTHHLALRNELVDFEIWIREDGDPLPQKLAVTWKLEDALPSFVARFRTWDFSPSFDDTRFQFEAPPNTEQIEIIPAAPDDQEGT